MPNATSKMVAKVIEKWHLVCILNSWQSSYVREDYPFLDWMAKFSGSWHGKSGGGQMGLVGGKGKILGIFIAMLPRFPRAKMYPTICVTFKDSYTLFPIECEMSWTSRWRYKWIGIYCQLLCVHHKVEGQGFYWEKNNTIFVSLKVGLRGAEWIMFLSVYPDLNADV